MGEQVRVLALSAGRRDGNCEVLLKEALLAAQDSCAAQVELIRLNELDIRPCTGCEGCMKGLIAGREGRCVLTGDDFPWLLDQVLQADGLILGAPIYDLIPCGRLINLLNRALGAGRSHRDACRAKPKIAAALAVGGSDWTDLTEPLLQITLTNLAKGCVVVDRLVAGGNTAPAMALLDDGLVERVRTLGRRVADGLLHPEQAGWQGEDGVCPVCRCGLLRPIGGMTAACPFCGVRGTVDVSGGVLVFRPDPASAARERFSPAGEADHQADIRAAHAKARASAGELKTRLERLRRFGPVCRPTKEQ